MAAGRTITIVGGGLAGLTLGIGLRRRGIPVVLREAGSYPRHRVCGEIICGRGLDVLRELDLHEKFVAAGGRPGSTVSFHSLRHSCPERTLPSPSLSLSRFVLDDLLAREFRALGGVLRENERVKPSEFGPGVVRATGRRIEVHPSGVKWIGIKAHAINARMASDIEMHCLSDGYVGLCRLAGDEINVCGLFRVRGAVRGLTDRWQELLRGPEGSLLRGRLGGAAFKQESFCAVAGLDLKPRSSAGTDDCRIGDAVTMIPPVTGNGMSMALESARWAIEPLAAYSQGGLDWDGACVATGRRCDEGFRRRLRWASVVQRMLMCRGGREVLLWLGSSERVWRMFFNGTR